MLEDKNVNLRIVEKEDLPLIVEWRGSLEFQSEYDLLIQESKVELEKRYDNFRPGEKWFLIEKEDGSKIGLARADERILAALKDGKPRSFTTLLAEVGFSHNTLQHHLDQLVARSLVAKQKMASNSPGRPKFAYHVPSTAAKQVTAALQNPYETLLTLQFTLLRHLCRFEKGGYCKETKKSCAPQNCPQNPKTRIIPILHRLFNSPALAQ